MNLREELLAIRERRGLLTPPIVVEEAKTEDHPLHSHFEWDDTVAGEEWRLVQARQLIASVRITYTRPNGTEGQVREFLNVRQDNGHRVYEPAEDVVQSPFATELVLRQMRRDWERFKARYEGFEEFRRLITGEADGLVS